MLWSNSPTWPHHNFLGSASLAIPFVLHLSMASPQPAILEQMKLAMAATNSLFNDEVFGKRNFAALDDIYTAEARILPPGAPMITVREDIRKFWSDLVTSLNATSCLLISADTVVLHLRIRERKWPSTRCVGHRAVRPRVSLMNMAWRAMSSFAIHLTCPLRIMFIASIP